MATTFDPITAYATDWRWIDGVEDCTFHRRDSNGEVIESLPAKLLVMGQGRSDYQPYGQGVMGAHDTPDGYLWLLPLPEGAGYPDPPAIDDAIERPSDQTELAIKEVDDPRRQPYAVTLAEVRSA